MDAINPIRFVEQFHLLFLIQFSRRVDKRSVVVRGGCNLRFFHRSIRYSKDMDLDVGEVETQVLRDNVREVFASRPFAQILEARGIRIDHVTEHKQTDTTQRWKLGLRVGGAPIPLPTRIEFSRRSLDEGVTFGSVDVTLARAYQLPPLMVSHYDAATAFRQKAGALAGRRETQARDVFDVYHLRAIGGTGSAVMALDPRVAERASANALTVDFGMFKSQVLA
ncbi:MAG: nucleotidyl transferase AbiEii/AbiGii toxin family protein, partial [Spirochaetes bacterium]|nr:nucleotidyl transferase AbiEii/AbiGii toxin family protein [Spirochaetota bacterium]